MVVNAEEGLSVIYDLHHQGKTVEMVIADLIMPGMTGDTFLEIINTRFPHIIKILLTGHLNLDSALYTINNANLDKSLERLSTGLAVELKPSGGIVFDHPAIVPGKNAIDQCGMNT